VKPKVRESVVNEFVLKVKTGLGVLVGRITTCKRGEPRGCEALLNLILARVDGDRTICLGDEAGSVTNQ
jgi:hypothetical protein